jgi:lipoprotein NlpI
MLQYDLSNWPPARANFRKALELHAISQDPRFYLWLIQAQSGEHDTANKELTEYLKTLRGDKAKEWPASVARYLTGVLSETEFVDQATSTAKRPSAIRGQKCESFYYAGMKRKLAGDKRGAAEFFQKAVDAGDDNNFTYFSSKVELGKQ